MEIVKYKDLSGGIKFAVVWTYIQLGASIVGLLLGAIIGLSIGLSGLG